MIDVDLKPSVVNWLIVGLMAITFIVLAKYLVNTYENPVTLFMRDFLNAV